jgi:single-stranded-DNA-specific exonuclease
MGFELVIVDHHQLLDKTPKVSLIVDPKQKGDKYPFKGFAAAGLAFLLSQEILGKEVSASLRNGFLELAAVATIADMMPQTDDNEIIIEEGLASLRNTLRPGLKVFYEIIGEDLSSRQTLQKIISALNITEATDDWLNETYRLLTSGSIEDSKKIAEKLIQKSEAKQFKVREIVREVEERIKGKANEKMIFEGDSFWPLILAGSVASILSQKYDKPAFIYRESGSESYGSVRTPKNINSVDAMQTCAGLLITFGGHPAASGFRIKNENLQKFKEGLTKYFNNLKV